MSKLQLIPSGSPPQWVDRMEIAVRGEVPVATLRFFSVCTPFIVEGARLQMSTDHLKQIVDVLCRTLTYYPSKAEQA